MDIALQIHSYLRYFILIMLILVIIKSTLGWISNKPYTNLDNKLSLYLLIFTHLQLIAGIVLYFKSGLVQFNGETMKNDTLRYWTVEHVTGMLVAIALITAGRSTSKKMPTGLGKHKRLVVFNFIALAIIIGIIVMSKRPII